MTSLSLGINPVSVNVTHTEVSYHICFLNLNKNLLFHNWHSYHLCSVNPEEKTRKSHVDNPEKNYVTTYVAS